MNDDLRPYPEYKDSGVEWMGKVPAHWEVKRLKRVAQLDPSKAEARFALTANEMVSFLPMGRVTSEGRIHPREPVPAADVWNGFTYFRRGDVIVAKITPCFENGKGACLDILPTEFGFGSTEFVVLRPKAEILHRFLYRVTTLAEFRSRGADAMKGAAGQQRVPADFMGNFLSAIPPLPEQHAIARYLDHLDRRIRRFLRAKQSLIALLNEHKQAIIHRAVTRGLDPQVKLKPSGVAWLRNMPEHWDISSIGRFSKVGNGSTPSRGNGAYWSNGSYPWLNSSQVNRGTIDSSDQFVSDVALRECHLPRVTPGSVLVAITGQGKTRGTAAILRIESTINQHIAYITPKTPGISPEYLHLALTGAYLQLRAISNDAGSTKGALTCEDIKRFKIPVPPLEEQLALISKIHDESRNIELAKVRTEHQIALMREYRTRLIADLVTGKLDVRLAAAGLAVEGEELPLLDEPLAEDEEGSEEADFDRPDEDEPA